MKSETLIACLAKADSPTPPIPGSFEAPCSCCAQAVWITRAGIERGRAMAAELVCQACLEKILREAGVDADFLPPNEAQLEELRAALVRLQAEG